MGAYCRYCRRRCFVVRVLADNRSMCLATCPEGMALDRQVTGQDHTTAHNPCVADMPCQPECLRCRVAISRGKGVAT